jgi:hypothetical protein
MKTLKNSIIELRKMNFTGKQISEKLNCATSTVSFHLKNEGIGGLIKKEKNYFIVNLKKETIENIISLRMNKKTFKEINIITKISKDKISAICKLHNLPKITRNGYKTISEDMVINMIKSYSECNNLSKVAKLYNISRGTVRFYVKPKERNEIIDKRKYNVEAVTKTRQKRKIELIKYKGGKCENCEYNKTNSALQFHHINPEEKDFTIGGKNYSWDIMKKEVDKCILVCANCHCEIHEEIRNFNYSNIMNKILKIK